MRAVVIGAGRGSRLQHLTEEVPKTLVEVAGRPMLEWILDALAAAGFARSDVLFICGYRAEVIQARYPDLTYVHNAAWERNNILGSLMTARNHLGDGFVCTYADIVYTRAIARDVAQAPGDRVLGCDTGWRRRYVGRSQHPETDAEKLRASGQRVLELSRRIASEEAHGEFIGVAKLTPEGARSLLDAYDRVAARLRPGDVYREGRTFERAYLIDLFQEMLEDGVPFTHADTPGGYMELDTLEDIAAASRWLEEFPHDG